MPPPAQARLTQLPLPAWPERDRSAWERLFSEPAGLFEEGGEARGLSPCTQVNYRRAYGLWLAHLASTGALDPATAPEARVTPARLDAWIAAMRAANRKDSTIRLYLTCLHALLRLIASRTAPNFILKPGGRPLSRILPVWPKPFVPVDTEDVFKHVQALNRAALAGPPGFSQRTALRDAALMALFLRRAPRVSSVAAMRLGNHLVHEPDGGISCRFPRGDTKSRRAMAWPLDRACATMMTDYLERARPTLPGARATDALWVGNHGRPLTSVGITAIFGRRTKDWLGTAMGPHMARKWLRSSAARRSPEAAFDAAEVLDHSPQVSLKHYAAANEIAAARRHARRIQKLRRDTVGLAKRSYGDMDRERT